MCPNVYRRRSRAPADRTARVPKRTWIARVSSRTILIHCDGAWMRDVNEGNRASRVNKANRVSRVRASRANRISKVNRDSAASRVNRARKGNRARANRDNQVNNKVNKKVSNLAAHRMAVTVEATANTLAHSGDQPAVTGATTGNFPRKCANDYERPRTYDASGAPPDWAPVASTK